MDKHMNAKDLIKKTTSVPETFIDELFEFYDEHTLSGGTGNRILLSDSSKSLHHLPRSIPAQWI